MNQGEFYVYSPDGGLHGIDTIKVEGGRFTYETTCREDFTLMLVFPNYSEQPVFAESGKSVDIKADASHLKELKVEGTKTNELMNQFREQILKASPPEEKKYAEQFIKDHPDSPISLFLVRKYFVLAVDPDFSKANTLLNFMAKAQPKDVMVSRLRQQIGRLKDVVVGSKLPTFTAYDTNGKLISSSTLATAPVAVITSWSSYNYDSQEMQRDLKRRQRSAKGRLQLMSISLDASKVECERTMKRDSISWGNVCNGDMLEDKTLQKLGLSGVPDNIVLKDGKIIARSLNKKALKDKLDELLK